MSDYLVTDTELTSVANAIRTKGGTSANLSFPTEFVSAINGIGGGGIIPTGTLSITENGTFDVTNFANALVNVTGGLELEYETGLYVPTSATETSKLINFSNTHDKYPVILIVADRTGSAIPDTTNYYTTLMVFINTYKLLGGGLPDSSSSGKYRYGVLHATQKGTSISSTTSFYTSYAVPEDDVCQSTTTGNVTYYVSKTQFRAVARSTSYPFRNTRKYRWGAFWLPSLI